MKNNLMLVGEAWGEEEERVERPFVGASGRFLRALLSRVGISFNECYVTNVFNLRPQPTNDISNLCGPKASAIPGWPALASSKYVQHQYLPHIERLHEEVTRTNPNCIVALGGTALWALTRTSKLVANRGTPMEAITGHKVLPTYHPAAVLREYKNYPILLSDLAKAKAQAEFPEIRRPFREFLINPTLIDLINIEARILSAPLVSVDIETKGDQITCIGFAPSPDFAVVIPFHDSSKPDGNYWPTKEAELSVWKLVRRWLSECKAIVGQNFAYDASYLLKNYGIVVRNWRHDTMLLHHALQPELMKGLGFLGSIYTEEPSWKFMRKGIATLKREDE